MTKFKCFFFGHEDIFKLFWKGKLNLHSECKHCGDFFKEYQIPASAPKYLMEQMIERQRNNNFMPPNYSHKWGGPLWELRPLATKHIRR